jgi:hypothetical protein
MLPASLAKAAHQFRSAGAALRLKRAQSRMNQALASAMISTAPKVRKKTSIVDLNFAWSAAEEVESCVQMYQAMR